MAHYYSTLYFSSLTGSDDPTINFTECEKRSCTNVTGASFPLSLGRTPDLDPRITLCSDIAQLFSGEWFREVATRNMCNVRTNVR